MAHRKSQQQTNNEGGSLKKFQNYFFILPAIFIVLSVISIGLWGLNPGIDLSGGSLLEVSYSNDAPEEAVLEDTLEELGYGEVRAQPAGENAYILRQRVLTPQEKQTFDKTLAQFGEFTQVRYTSVGPSIGAELIHKAWWAIGAIILLTILFIAWAFRGVSYPVSSWKYGVVVIISLLHDILIPIGLFAYLGHVEGNEIGALFIVALLTVFGISINDTIVVFDRIRENLALNQKNNRDQTFKDVVWKSIVQTMTRSINTSLTVVVVLLALVFYGPESIHNFSIVLAIGMIAGTYSSIFLAAPLLVLIEKYQKPPQKKDQKKRPPMPGMPR